MMMMMMTMMMIALPPGTTRGNTETKTMAIDGAGEAGDA
jgi:hypothetical protein